MLQSVQQGAVEGVPRRRGRQVPQRRHPCTVSRLLHPTHMQLRAAGSGSDQAAAAHQQPPALPVPPAQLAAEQPGAGPRGRHAARPPRAAAAGICTGCTAGACGTRAVQQSHGAVR